MRAVKGSIDATVLIVLLTPMVLLLILASFFIAEEGVKSSLYAEVNFNENSFQTATAHSIVMNETVRRKLGFFQYQDEETMEKWNRSVSRYAERVLSSQSNVYGFRAAEGEVEIESETYGQDYRFSTYVASPSREMVTARSALGGDLP
ncbi:MAG: hypothetical protein ACI8Z7_000066 [Candidatus Nanohaloarchaea archaeon]